MSIISRRSLVGSSILVAENVLRLGLVAAVSLWIAHQLGPAQFGLLNYASALVAVFWSAAMLGLETPLTARLALSSTTGLVLGSAIALRVASGVLGAILALIAATILRGDDSKVVLLTAIVAMAVPLSAPVVVDAWFKSHNDALPPALARLLATILSCAAKAACLVLGGGVAALAWTVVLESLLVAGALLVAYRVRRPAMSQSRLSVRYPEMLSLVRESWPFFLSALVVAVYVKLDVLMMGALTTNEQTGLYSLSQKLSEVLFMIPVVLVDVLFPQLVRHHAQHGGAAAAPQIFFDMVFATALLTTMAAIACVFVALPVLFGEPYRPTVSIFMVHAWACLGVGLGHALFKWMAATGRQSLAVWVAMIGLMVAFFMHIVLIPRYGAMGAATGTVFAFLTSGWLAAYAFPSLRPAARMQARALWPWARLWREWCQRRDPTRVVSR